jgi:hypothetical protein
MNLFVFKATSQCDQLHLQQFKMDNHVGYDNQTPLHLFALIHGSFLKGCMMVTTSTMAKLAC